MDIIRRAGEGRLSEVMGEKSVPFDKMFRTVGLKRIVDRNIKSITAKSLSLLNGICKRSKSLHQKCKGKISLLSLMCSVMIRKEWKPEHSLMVWTNDGYGN
ncbi:MAG: penicillin acylase family protein [Ignavibacteriales bacterium]|nr:penicillin acylase family protein [Ignavibacteriales bacterium]